MLLPAWVNNPRLSGGVLTINKKSIVKSLQVLLPEEMPETVQVKDKKTGPNFATADEMSTLADRLKW